MVDGNKLLQNLLLTMRALLPPKSTRAAEPPPAKRIKREETPSSTVDDTPPEFDDPYGIWLGQTEDPPNLEGAMLVQLTTAGLINALTGKKGGIVDAKLLAVDKVMKLDSIIPTANSMVYRDLRHAAVALHRVVQTRLEADFLVSTPSRIQDMLSADLEPHEFKAVRRRVFETVIEGRGRGHGGDNEGEDLPVASRTAEHDIEKVSVC